MEYNNLGYITTGSFHEKVDQEPKQMKKTVRGSVLHITLINTLTLKLNMQKSY